MQPKRWIAISLVALVGIVLTFIVVRYYLKHSVPHEKVAEIAQDMKEQEVFALLGPPHGGLPKFLSPYSPETYPWSWEYDDGTLVIWFDSETNLVKSFSVFGVAEPTFFEKVWDRLMSLF